MKSGFSLYKTVLFSGLVMVSVSSVQASEPSATPAIAPSVDAKPFNTAAEAINIKPSGFSPEKAAFKAAGGLLLMVGVLFAVAYVAKRKGLMRSSGQRKLMLRETLNLGAKEKLAVIEFAGESMVVGITAHNIRLIRSVKKSEAEDYQANSELGAKNAFDFQAKLNDFLLKG